MNTRILAMVQATPTTDLCDAWNLRAPAVEARKKGKRPLTFREVGALCRVNGVYMSTLLSGAGLSGPGLDNAHEVPSVHS